MIADNPQEQGSLQEEILVYDEKIASLDSLMKSNRSVHATLAFLLDKQKRLWLAPNEPRLNFEQMGQTRQMMAFLDDAYQNFRRGYLDTCHDREQAIDNDRRARRMLEARRAEEQRQIEISAQQITFENRMGEMDIMRNFTSRVARSLEQYLDEKCIELNITESGLRMPTNYRNYAEARNRHVQRRGYELPTIRAISLLLAGCFLAHPVDHTLPLPEICRELFIGADIQKILEVGPSYRGGVHYLAESGLAELCNLSLTGLNKGSPHNIPDFDRLGIQFIDGDAQQTEDLITEQYDAVFLAGVLSRGALFDYPKDSSGYPESIAQSHAIINSLANVVRPGGDCRCHITIWDSFFNQK